MQALPVDDVLAGASLDALPDGVLVTDGDGAVLALNDAGARLLGRPASEAVGRTLAEVLPLQDPAVGDWWACLRPFSGLATRTRLPERRLRLVDGSRPEGEGPVLLVTARILRTRPAGPVSRLVVSFRDGDSRDRRERSPSDLVATVAHELRSPLTSVKGFTATLLAKWERFNDDQKRVMLQTVNADADRVTRLITELLDVSRIDAGRIELRRQVVDLGLVVERVVAGRVAAGEDGSRFVLERGAEPPEMWVDPDKMVQVLGNLVENAVRHGRGTVHVRIEAADVPLRGGGTTAGAQVLIDDEGPGVPPEMRTRVFGRFYRAHRGGGSGLGLYVVRGLVEAHGGSVSVTEAPAGGARFRVLLPAGTPSFA